MDSNVIQSMNLPDEARRSALFADFKWADQDGKSVPTESQREESSDDDGSPDEPECLKFKLLDDPVVVLPAKNKTFPAPL